ncbi:MAG: acyl-CoA dehydratase activase-related protein [Syntrophomonadaceae bacterium]|mgnify:CR=1 FL=1|nr:acyl-CoA dehydratase activase-related protein [Syntrophomonadaceae bacterium]MDD3890078.1 acyl-CoA dehydratase activase-related protein [Syntrophomonadaceae bacterium]MDD4548705.1 acyl-CoA dehydratase activase-related protein [Syntrophomonadaceae bacterium]
MKRVGIPHGLFYYYYYPLWKTFFNSLGAEVVTSPATNRLIVDAGIQKAVDETCLPIKVYFGHVFQLCQQNLDYIFIPRLVSIEAKSYICPKFMGVPDMIKATIPGLPPVIDIVIDLSKTDKLLKKDIFQLGRLFTRDNKAIRNAYKKGLQEYYFCRALAGQGYTMSEAIQVWEGTSQDITGEYDLNLGLLGHGYSLYDENISMNIVNKVRAMGCRVHLPETCDRKSIEAEAATIPKRVFWTLGRKMVGSALHMDKRKDIDGMIYVACFGCGPDSLIGEIIERKIKNKPFMLITIDEHTGEGGLVTRLEAFCDMLRRRRASSENNISSHG